jgi:hypothetical protein
MDKNTIAKDAYLKLINSDIIKNVYPMVDHIDIVEFKKLPNLSTIYDLSVNIFVDDIDMTIENMYDSNFDPHWLTDHYLKNIAKYLGLSIRIIRFNLYDTNGRLIKTLGFPWDN